MNHSDQKNQMKKQTKSVECQFQITNDMLPAKVSSLMGNHQKEVGPSTVCNKQIVFRLTNE